MRLPRLLFLVVISPENIGYHRNRLLLFLIKDFRINLCCRKLLVPEKFLNCVNVCAEVKH